MSINKALYTAILGNYDDLKEPTIVSPGWDYICFTDQDLKSDVWQIRKIDYEGDPQRMARRIKILFNEYIDHEYSFWLDAAFHIHVDLNEFWKRYWQNPFSVPSHPARNDIFREIESCLANQRGNPEELLRQKADYEKLNLKRFNGIITSGVMMRKRTEQVVDLCQQWWEELSKYSTRDQVAFAKITQNWRIPTYRWDYSQSKELKYIKHIKYRH